MIYNIVGRSSTIIRKIDMLDTSTLGTANSITYEGPSSLLCGLISLVFSLASPSSPYIARKDKLLAMCRLFAYGDRLTGLCERGPQQQQKTCLRTDAAIQKPSSRGCESVEGTRRCAEQGEERPGNFEWEQSKPRPAGQATANMYPERIMGAPPPDTEPICGSVFKNRLCLRAPISSLLRPTCNTHLTLFINFSVRSLIRFVVSVTWRMTGTTKIEYVLFDMDGKRFPPDPMLLTL